MKRFGVTLFVTGLIIFVGCEDDPTMVTSTQKANQPRALTPAEGFERTTENGTTLTVSPTLGIPSNHLQVNQLDREQFVRRIEASGRSLRIPNDAQLVTALTIEAGQGDELLDFGGLGVVLAIPSNTRAYKALPSNALPSSALPSSALPSSALPSSLLPSGGLPSNLFPSADQAVYYLKNIAAAEPVSSLSKYERGVEEITASFMLIDEVGGTSWRIECTGSTMPIKTFKVDCPVRGQSGAVVINVAVFTMFATDAFGLTLDDEPIALMPNELILGDKKNKPPVFNSEKTFFIDAGAKTTYVLEANDPDGDYIFAEIDALPSFALRNQQLITLHPDEKDIGNHPFRVRLRDNGNPTLSTEELVTVKVQDVGSETGEPQNPYDLILYSWNGAETLVKEVKLRISARDISGISAYCINENAATPIETDPCWQIVEPRTHYEEDLEYTLIGGQGLHQLYGWFRSESGTVSSSISTRIEYYGPFDGNEWVKIDGGKALIGAQNSDQVGLHYDPDGRTAVEGPVVEIVLTDYQLLKYEVSAEEFQRCVDDDGCTKLGDGGVGTISSVDRNDHPVNFVTWYEAREYCRWLGKSLGKTVDLPSEAQWEYALRKQQTGEYQRYPWGDEDPNLSGTPVANCTNSDCSDVFSETASVGSFESGKSDAGLYDMAGNVWEWVLDDFDSGWYTELSEKLATDPSNLHDYQEQAVIRGGSFESSKVQIRSAYRMGMLREKRDKAIGFRCAEQVQ